MCHDWGGAIGFERSSRVVSFRSLVVTNTAAFPSSRIPRASRRADPLLGRVGVPGGNAARAALHDDRSPARGRRDGLIAPYDGWANREQVWRFVKDIPMRPTPLLGEAARSPTGSAPARPPHGDRVGHAGLVLLARVQEHLGAALPEATSPSSRTPVTT